ncbi:hypothetical protein AMECASPLE_026776 [Ameca splendens]|uniref:Uncharacterized protein n=1 Tax=Ameca splendens TaxID=208324 RepID=A0ABV0XU87_9TELE
MVVTRTVASVRGSCSLSLRHRRANTVHVLTRLVLVNQPDITKGNKISTQQSCSCSGLLDEPSKKPEQGRMAEDNDEEAAGSMSEAEDKPSQVLRKSCGSM